MVVSDTLVHSLDAPAPRLAPRKSTASATSAADRVSVPLSICEAVTLARPGSSVGSPAEPPGIRSWTVTTGCSWFSTTISLAPFRSVRSS